MCLLTDKNIEHRVGAQFQLIIHDAVEPVMLEVDQIYHLACLLIIKSVTASYNISLIYSSILFTYQIIKTNTEETLNMLGMAKKVKVFD